MFCVWVLLWCSLCATRATPFAFAACSACMHVRLHWRTGGVAAVLRKSMLCCSQMLLVVIPFLLSSHMHLLLLLASHHHLHCLLLLHDAFASDLLLL